MDCNKDESLRAKSIAEEKLEKKDFAGARKFALKAQKLYPGLDGISQMLTTIEVHMSAENKISGEVDWYSVLGLNPSVDDEAIRKQYRKLALMLHPDKNKCFGADGAFMLISEAYGMLSDKINRLAYNQRMGFKVVEQKVPMPTGGPSPSAPPPPSTAPPPSSTAPPPPPPSTAPPPPPPSKESGIFNSSSKATSKTPKRQTESKRTAPSAPKPAPCTNPSPPDTFWTICNHCKVQYEHLKKHLNCTLLCNNCKTPYMALATSPPQKLPKSSNRVRKQRQQSSSNMSAAQKPVAGQAGPSLFGNANYQQGPLPSGSDPAVHMDHGAEGKLKRAFAESGPEEESLKKRKFEDSVSGFRGEDSAGAGNIGFGSANSSASASGSRSYGFSSTNSQPNITRKLTALETRKMLIENTRKQILMKLSAWGSTTDEARGNVGGTNKNEDPEKSHPQKIRKQIEVLRGKGLKMLLVLSCVKALGGSELSWPCIVLLVIGL